MGISYIFALMQASVFRTLWMILLAAAFQCALLFHPNGPETHFRISNPSAPEITGQSLQAGKTHAISQFYLHAASASIFVSTEIQKTPFYQDFILTEPVVELGKNLLQHQLAKINIYYADIFQLILFPFHGFW